MYGMCHGFTFPLTYILIQEIIPFSIRGRAVLIPVLLELLGRLAMVYLATFYMQSFERGDWKMMSLLNTIPVVISLISCLLLKESPRYLLHKGFFYYYFIIRIYFY
jgi:hypothetical protein